MEMFLRRRCSGPVVSNTSTNKETARPSNSISSIEEVSSTSRTTPPSDLLPTPTPTPARHTTLRSAHTKAVAVGGWVQVQG